MKLLHLAVLPHLAIGVAVGGKKKKKTTIGGGGGEEGSLEYVVKEEDARNFVSSNEERAKILAAHPGKSITLKLTQYTPCFPEYEEDVYANVSRLELEFAEEVYDVGQPASHSDCHHNTEKNVTKFNRILKKFDNSKNSLRKLNHLAGLTNIEELALDLNNADITPLQNMKELKKLTLTGYAVNFSVLQNFAKLEYLDISGAEYLNIQHILPAKDTLKYLHASTDIRSPSSSLFGFVFPHSNLHLLNEFNQLTELNFSKHYTQSKTPNLTTLPAELPPNLTKLILSRTAVTDFSPLIGLNSLKYVEVENMLAKLKSLAPLLTLPNLVEVKIDRKSYGEQDGEIGSSLGEKVKLTP